MFESAELGHCISKSEYGAAVPKLREALLKTQYELLADKDRKSTRLNSVTSLSRMPSSA